MSYVYSYAYAVDLCLYKLYSSTCVLLVVLEYLNMHTSAVLRGCYLPSKLRLYDTWYKQRTPAQTT